ncbi:hypothetical protein HanHA300_Chr15g0583551 [Helianthus annuus]|nr:hypothetical protein HanHA300_Chr15g0583551 [Helianthus annuus]KAJ0474752.1 hypothetical protein HanHA89_Chr15g0633341 [Helianthus annuus]KAJ0650306.1 hypothetical protein HanLR1_Chr15g0594251 [Helianthus annuus]KAJ0654078.1 hypothetical protein HanOQP8_Chr15g0590861 [Helianthus annuus]
MYIWWNISRIYTCTNDFTYITRSPNCGQRSLQKKKISNLVSLGIQTNTKKKKKNSFQPI